jgi:hypothetical protein
MAQRSSGFHRVHDDQYETPAEPVIALIPYLADLGRAWDPCDRGRGQLVMVLRAYGIDAVGTREDFLTTAALPADVDAIVTNPPYGTLGRLAEAFIAHALKLVPFVAMLLRVDFDSAKTRQHLFRDNRAFAGKLILLDRIKWFEGPSCPSDNHAWFIFDRGHRGPPVIRYTRNSETETVLPASTRWLPSSVATERVGRGVTAAPAVKR